LDNLKPLFEQAALHLDRKQNQETNKTSSNDNTIFLHRTYHPFGPSRNIIRYAFQQILEPVLDYDRMIIATARPSNLRDLLTKARLNLPEDINIQNMLDEFKTTNT
jgi:hypothetical protein